MVGAPQGIRSTNHKNRFEESAASRRAGGTAKKEESEERYERRESRMGYDMNKEHV